jgi:hypothetical protein
MNGSWSVSTLIRDDAQSRYFVYVNETEVDLLGGFFGGLIRAIIERQLKGEAVAVLTGLRKRLESGPPPPG